jgi:hypothetical protein
MRAGVYVVRGAALRTTVRSGVKRGPACEVQRSGVPGTEGLERAFGAQGGHVGGFATPEAVEHAGR